VGPAPRNSRGLATVACLVACLGCAPLPEPASATVPGISAVDYTVTVFDDFERATVRACLQGRAITGLVPIDDGSAGLLSGAWLDGSPLAVRAGNILLPRAQSDTCVDYAVRFGATPWRLGDFSSAILSQTHWLWRPDPLPPQIEARVRFDLPEDAQLSVPWPQSGDALTPEQTVFFTESYSVFGSFERDVFFVGDTRIEVARLGPEPSAADVRRWLARAVEVAASVGGRIPSRRLHFVVLPVAAHDRPVLFGMLRRGGGPSVLLLPSSTASLAELQADWVAIHEVSHLWLPRLRARDRWISEGIATYLQEVLRARCGLLSSEQAWARLEEGFKRGRRAGTGRKLSDESTAVNRTGAYHRVYWAGAAFALEVDVRLRTQTGGEVDLMGVLSATEPLWRDELHPVSGPTLLRALDRAGDSRFIEELGRAYATTTDFPTPLDPSRPEHLEAFEQIMARDEECGVISGSSK
jgi:hypothetical protein